MQYWIGCMVNDFQTHQHMALAGRGLGQKPLHPMNVEKKMTSYAALLRHRKCSALAQYAVTIMD